MPWKAFYYDQLRVDIKDSGAYLVNDPAHCAECYSPRNLLDVLSQRTLTGNEMGLKGIGTGISTVDLSDWTIAYFWLFLDVGMTPSGNFTGGQMTDVIEFSTGILSTDDRAAIANYLLSEEYPP